MEEDFRQYFSGVLYSLKTTAGDGDTHVLIEHQSTPDKHMAFRLMRYAITAMQRHLEAGHKRRMAALTPCGKNLSISVTWQNGWTDWRPYCWPDIFLHHRWYDLTQQ